MMISVAEKLSTVVVPLMDLLESTATFLWSPVCQSVFNTVTNLLHLAPVLAPPLLYESFKLQVDASKLGGRAVLL